MAELSDQLLVVTILGYLAAMLCYAAEYAFGVSGLVARAADRELVGASAPGGGEGARQPGETASDDAGSSPPAGSPGVVAGSPGVVAGRMGIAAVLLTAGAVAAHAATLVTRAGAAGRVPWGNMYEFLLALCLVGAVVWLVLLRVRPTARPLGLLVTLVLVLLLGSAGMVYTEAGPLVPALNSYWLKIHVSAAAISAGIFLVGFVAAVLYLLRAGLEEGRVGFPYALAVRAPAAANLERLAFRVNAFAFPIWTIAIMLGAIWAEAAWGRYWGWDPKETWSLITWVIYAGYLHARATPSIKRRTTIWISIVGWAAMLFNVYGVNLVFSGLHSYAGTN